MARRAREVDEHAKTELQLYVDNDEPLYRRIKAVEEMLAKGICRRKNYEKPYSSELAANVFSRVLLDAAHKYSREFSSGGDGPRVFNATTRRALALDYADDFKHRVNAYLKHGTQDITKTTADRLTACGVKPLAGRAQRYRRR
jgi:hypothetical protein